MMHIAKKLFLITILSLGTGVHINASESATNGDQSIFDSFINNLKSTYGASLLELTNWMNRAYLNDDALYQQIMAQIKSNDSLENKREALKKLKQSRELMEEAEKNKSYFSNMSTLAAAAAFIITASIASYFYFMAPWRSSNQ
jgi:hypothetical protein